MMRLEHNYAASTMRRAVVLIGALALVGALYLARDLLVLVALAIFLSFLLTPLVKFVERTRIGRVTSVVMVVGLSAALVGGLGWLVGTQAAGVAAKIPKYTDNIVAKVRAVRDSVSGFSRIASQTVEQIKQADAQPDAYADAGAQSRPTSLEDSSLTGPPFVESAPDAPRPDSAETPVRVEVVRGRLDLLALAESIVPPLLHLLASAGVAAIFAIFILIYREDLRDRVLRLCGRARLQVTTSALSDMGERLTRFLVVQVIVNGINAVAVAVGLLLIGVPNAVLWGFLAGLLRFVPFVGLWVAGALPVALAIAVFESWWPPVLAAAWLLSVDLFSGNVVEPWLYGARTGASPSAVIASLVFWTWLWGAIGLLLATPITVCLVVLGKYIPQLEVFYILLSDRPALEAHVRIYQRLLARDRGEVTDIVRKAMAEMPPQDVLDRLIFPALAEIELDHRAGGLDAPCEAFIQEVVEGVAEELLAGEAARASAAAPIGPVRVLLVPDQGPFDATVGKVLARLSTREGRRAESLSPKLLTAEIIERVREESSPTVVIVTLHSAKPKRVAHLCRRIQAAGDPVRILVGPWTDAARSAHWRDEVSRVPRTQVCNQLAGALLKLARSAGATEQGVSEPEPAVAVAQT